MTHDDLVKRAEKWLKNQGCNVVFRDDFNPPVYTGEQPDAIGWMYGISVLIECKTSRSDFHADKKKRFRITPSDGMGDFRFFMSPPDIIKPDELPDGWGLLYATSKQIKKIVGYPRSWRDKKPFQGNKEYECQMMYGALRRMVLRGHFDGIYQKLERA